MSDFFLQIFLFLGGTFLGIAVPLLPKTYQKWIAGILGAMLVLLSIVWSIVELTNPPLGAASPTPTSIAKQQTSTAILATQMNPTTTPTTSILVPTNSALLKTQSSEVVQPSTQTRYATTIPTSTWVPATPTSPPPTPAPVPKAISTPTRVPAPPSSSSGIRTIPGAGCLDLDTGAGPACDNLQVDVWWEQVDNVNRYLVSKNGALLSVWGTNSPSYQDCANAPVNTDSINGSNNSQNQIPVGTYLCGRTSNNKVTKFKILSYGYDLMVDYTTW